MRERMTKKSVKSNFFSDFFWSVEHSARRGTFHLEMKLDFFLKKSLTGAPGLARIWGKFPTSYINTI